MRPTLNILSDELIVEILTEAKRIMAETGIEVRGENMRQRLLDHGLKTDDKGRVLFTPDVVDAAIAKVRRSRSHYSTATAIRTRKLAVTTFTTYPAPAD